MMYPVTLQDTLIINISGGNESNYQIFYMQIVIRERKL